ncbi:unnamed protein product [Nezara viridula]|uniref:Uncharacterized protein n=1 Tax=Nezara viridula TaxID=85310 RepID=A0A9P0EGM6_NEZVI|nr:unnamed protein product [Nezara viridula]
MDTIKLPKDELAYEFRIRGLSDIGDAIDLRKKLVKEFTENVQPLEEIIALLYVQEELEIFTGKYAALAERLEELSIELQERWKRQGDRVTFLITELWERKPVTTLPSLTTIDSASTSRTLDPPFKGQVIRDIKAYKWGLNFADTMLEITSNAEVDAIEQQNVPNLKCGLLELLINRNTDFQDCKKS